MIRVACLPLDDRPVNYDYPREMAAMAGFKIDLPDRDALGNPWRASRHAELVSWIERAAQRANALIVAVDTLGYGGLIPARTSSEPAEIVLERLSILRGIKERYPNIKILAFSVIMRICRDDSAEEEKEYWAIYGSKMFRLSTLEHKTAMGQANKAELAERKALRIQIPDAVYSDYLQGRARNHRINRAMVDWVEDGILEYLILPQDDTADFGWNIAEARNIQGEIRQRGLTSNAITYPGADETWSLLLARYACQLSGFTPQVWPVYSSQASANVITAYEDRPMHEMLKAHLTPLEGNIALSPEQADFLLFINAPAEVQGIAELQPIIQQQADIPEVHKKLQEDPYFRITYREMSTPRRSVEEFVRSIQKAISSGRRVAVADVAFVNGADQFLMESLLQTNLAPRLHAYAGWNTAGNSLGTVLAHATFNHLLSDSGSISRQQARLNFLFRRYLDDYFFQTLLRTELVYRDLPELGIRPSMGRLPEDKLPEIEGRLRSRLKKAAEELNLVFLKAGAARNIEVSNIRLPWQRLFEVGFDVDYQI